MAAGIDARGNVFSRLRAETLKFLCVVVAALLRAAPRTAAVAAPVAMEQPIAGDHWVYEVRDEITAR